MNSRFIVQQSMERTVEFRLRIFWAVALKPYQVTAMRFVKFYTLIEVYEMSP
jgi:hypothetical protein